MNGKQRIAKVTDVRDGIDVSVILAESEREVTLTGYSRTKPVVTAENGRVQLTGYDAESGQYALRVTTRSGWRMHEVHGDKFIMVDVQVRRRNSE